MHKGAHRFLLSITLLAVACGIVAEAQDAKMIDSKTISTNRSPSIASEQTRETEALRPQPAGVIVHDLNDNAIKQLIGRNGGRERPLLLYLWYTACEQCRTRLPDVQRIYDEDQVRGLDVVIVSINPIDTKEGLSKYLTENKVTVPAYLLGELDDDLAEDIFKKDWEVTVPAVFFYDKSGKVLFAETEIKNVSFDVLKSDAIKMLRTKEPSKNKGTKN